MGFVFLGPGVLIYIVAGIWGLVIAFGIVQAAFGTVAAFVSLIFAPALLAVAPWYAGLANGDWIPLLVIYGGGILGTVLIAIGTGLNEKVAE